MIRRSVLVIAAAVIAGTTVLGQQQQTASLPSFEVASVKPNKTVEQAVGLVGGQPGGVTFKNLVLRDLIRRSYRLQEFQVLGGPSWIDSERFDVLARTRGTPSINDKWAMMRTLLADRFALRVHTETRNTLVYRLVRARKDGKLGPQMRKSPSPCVAQMPCAVLGISRSGELSARTDPIDDFVHRGLMFLLSVPVIDETHLDGIFDIDLKWTPDATFVAGAADDSRPSIFTALREQLGLKLEPMRGPAEFLVIDHIERPTPD